MAESKAYYVRDDSDPSPSASIEKGDTSIEHAIGLDLHDPDAHLSAEERAAIVSLITSYNNKNHNMAQLGDWADPRARIGQETPSQA